MDEVSNQGCKLLGRMGGTVNQGSTPPSALEKGRLFLYSLGDAVRDGESSQLDDGVI
jgi:hypothetical protein